MDDAQAEKMNNMASMMLMMGGMFLFLGIILELTAFIQEFTKFAPLQEAYWNVDKATRDAAATGSQLNQQLADIKNFAPKLMLFKLTGIANILIGIFMVLVVIAKRLGGMPGRLGYILKK